MSEEERGKVTAEVLRELHRIHRQRADLRARLATGPRQVKAAESEVAKLEEAVRQAKEALTRIRVIADEKQLQLRQREDRVKNLEGKLNTCASNREYQALKEQIAADMQANSVQADEIYEALEQMEEQQAVVGARQQELAAAKGESDKVRQRVDQARQGLESELARVDSDLVRVEDQLPGDFRADYQRLAKGRGEDALAPVDGGCCGGCFQTLTPQSLNELLLSRPTFCKSCGCLLYIPEESGG